MINTSANLFDGVVKMEILIGIVIIFCLGYMLSEIIGIKKRVTRLTQENAILWEIARENEDR